MKNQELCNAIREEVGTAYDTDYGWRKFRVLALHTRARVVSVVGTIACKLKAAGNLSALRDLCDDGMIRPDGAAEDIIGHLRENAIRLKIFTRDNCPF